MNKLGLCSELQEECTSSEFCSTNDCLDHCLMETNNVRISTSYQPICLPYTKSRLKKIKCVTDPEFTDIVAISHVTNFQLVKDSVVFFTTLPGTAMITFLDGKVHAQSWQLIFYDAAMKPVTEFRNDCEYIDLFVAKERFA